MDIRILDTPEDLHAAAHLAIEIHRLESRVEQCEQAASADVHGDVVMGAFEGDGLVGTISAFCWADAPFSPADIERFDIERFDAVVSRDRMAVAHRLLIQPDRRGEALTLQLAGAMWLYLQCRDVQLVFSDCPHHLLATYELLGMRTYVENVDRETSESGERIPLVGTFADHDYLRSIDSPTLVFLAPDSEDHQVATRVRALVDTRPIGEREGHKRTRSVDATEDAVTEDAIAEDAVTEDAAVEDAVVECTSWTLAHSA